ncbi:MAG: hypothetical protein ACQEVA_05325 [Myxococcota bacterium]
MLHRVIGLVRRVVGGSVSESSSLVIGESPRSDSRMVIGIDFSGTQAVCLHADALVTIVEPAAVLDVAAFVARSGVAPDAWWIGGVAQMPYSPEARAQFLVEFARISGCPVFVDPSGLTGTSTRRFVAHLRRSAADARRRSLSPPVRVLSSGRNASRQAQ